jgi:hypothetical protein
VTASARRIGLWTVRYFKARRFNWLGLSKQPTLRAKVKRVAGQLLPWSYESFDWQLTSGAQRSPPCATASRSARLTRAGCMQAPRAACCASCRCWS